LTAARDNAMYLRTGANIYHHMIGYSAGTIDPATGIPVSLYEYSPEAVEKKTNATVRDFIERYNQKSLFDVYVAQTPVIHQTSMVSFGEAPSEIQNNVNGLNAYIGKNFAKVIAAKTDAEFNQLRGELIAGMTAFKVDEIFDYFYKEASNQDAEISKLIALMGK
jgi:hypothetical protein